MSLLSLAIPLAFAQTPAAEPETAEVATEAGPEVVTGPKTYTLDASQSRLFVLVTYDRKATIPGHDHVVAATTFKGTATWDPSDPTACKVSIAFPVTALEVDPGSSRSWAGLDGTTGDGDKRKIKDNFLGKYQLEGDKFPEISYQSTSCSGEGPQFQVKGNLTIHGVTAPVTADMTVQAADPFPAKGTFRTDHSQWGMKPYSALLGALKNAPELAFTVDVKGR